MALAPASTYAPQLGRFLQVDPVEGGNANAYDYCYGDPINCSDLDGRGSCGWCRKVSKGARAVGSWVHNNAGNIGAGLGLVSMFLPPPANLIVGGIALGFSAYSAYHSARKGDWAGVGLAAVGAIPGIGAIAKGGKALKAGRTAGRQANKYVNKFKNKHNGRKQPGYRANKNATGRANKNAALQKRIARRWDRATWPFAGYDAYNLGRDLWKTSGRKKYRKRR